MYETNDNISKSLIKTKITNINQLLKSIENYEPNILKLIYFYYIYSNILSEANKFIEQKINDLYDGYSIIFSEIDGYDEYGSLYWVECKNGICCRKGEINYLYKRDYSLLINNYHNFYPKFYKKIDLKVLQEFSNKFCNKKEKYLDFQIDFTKSNIKFIF